MSPAKQIEYLTTTSLSTEGELVLPSSFVEAQRLAPGAPITVLQLGGSLLLIPEQARLAQLCDAIATTLEQASISEDELQAGLAETREELARERYPELFAAELETAEANQ